jgi:hypothetical protein
MVEDLASKSSPILCCFIYSFELLNLLGVECRVWLYRISLNEEEVECTEMRLLITFEEPVLYCSYQLRLPIYLHMLGNASHLLMLLLLDR